MNVIAFGARAGLKRWSPFPTGDYDFVYLSRQGEQLVETTCPVLLHEGLTDTCIWNLVYGFHEPFTPLSEYDEPEFMLPYSARNPKIDVVVDFSKQRIGDQTIRGAMTEMDVQEFIDYLTSDVLVFSDVLIPFPFDSLPELRERALKRTDHLQVLT